MILIVAVLDHSFLTTPAAKNLPAEIGYGKKSENNPM
jgi:hypothetical protein